MDKCADAGIINDASKSCNIPNLVPENISGVLEKLPGDNPPTGWGQGESKSPSVPTATAAASGKSAYHRRARRHRAAGHA